MIKGRGKRFRRRGSTNSLRLLLSPPNQPSTGEWKRIFRVPRGIIRQEPIGSVSPFEQVHLVLEEFPSLRLQSCPALLLASYFDYYHRSRTHLSLNKDTPIGRPVQPADAGKIVAFPQVGGLHHRYERLAA